jgi:hypothetical protein
MTPEAEELARLRAENAAQAAERIDDYEVLLIFDAPPPSFPHEDMPDEIAIVRLNDNGGVMVKGRFTKLAWHDPEKWHANCGERGAVRVLMERLAEAEARAQAAEQELERWAKVSSERNHGASGLCCLLREEEKRKREAIERKLEEVRVACRDFPLTTGPFDVLAILNREDA